MTDIATRNGSIIVKGGSVGTDCGCCGGWYCCVDPVCLANPSRVVVNIEADDYVAQYNMRDNVNPQGAMFGPPLYAYKSSACFFGKCMAGEIELSKTLSQSGRSEWEATFPSTPTACQPVQIKVNLGYPAYAYYFDHIDIRVNPPTVWYFSPTQTKGSSDLSCQQSESPPYSGSAGSPNTEGGYSVQQQRIFTSSFPICADGTHTALAQSQTRPDNEVVEWHEDVAEVDSRLSQGQPISNIYRMLAADRRAGYASQIVSVISRSGSNVVNIRVTIYP